MIYLAVHYYWALLTLHFKNPRGQSMIEYLLIVTLIALIVLFGVTLFGEALLNKYNEIAPVIE